MKERSDHALLVEAVAEGEVDRVDAAQGPVWSLGHEPLDLVHNRRVGRGSQHPEQIRDVVHPGVPELRRELAGRSIPRDGGGADASPRFE